MISGSGALKERAVAGRPSVTRFTQSSWTGIRASGRPRAAVRKMQTTSPMLEEIRYLGEVSRIRIDVCKNKASRGCHLLNKVEEV